MGKKIEGKKNARGDVPWIRSGRGETHVGVDYAHSVSSTWSVRKDPDGSGVFISADDEGVWVPNVVIPMLIKALRKK